MILHAERILIGFNSQSVMAFGAMLRVDPTPFVPILHIFRLRVRARIWVKILQRFESEIFFLKGCYGTVMENVRTLTEV